jgi:hypothetical protein
MAVLGSTKNINTPVDNDIEPKHWALFLMQNILQ